MIEITVIEDCIIFEEGDKALKGKKHVQTSGLLSSGTNESQQQPLLEHSRRVTRYPFNMQPEVMLVENLSQDLLL